MKLFGMETLPEYIASLNWFDFILIVGLVWGIGKGLRKGLVSQVVGLAATIFGIKFAGRYYPFLAEKIGGYIALPFIICSIIAFIAIYLIVLTGFRMVIGWWRKATSESAVSLLDSVGGGFFGGLEALIIGSALGIFLSLAPFEPLASPVKGSAVMKLVSPLIAAAWGQLPQLPELDRKYIIPVIPHGQETRESDGSGIFDGMETDEL